MPSQSSSLPSDLQAFIKAEMTRRCLSSEEECLFEIVREAKARWEQHDSKDAGVDPRPGVDAPLDDDAFVELIQRRLDSADDVQWLSVDDWKKKERAVAARFDIDAQ